MFISLGCAVKRRRSPPEVPRFSSSSGDDNNTTTIGSLGWNLGNRPQNSMNSIPPPGRGEEERRRSSERRRRGEGTVKLRRNDERDSFNDAVDGAMHLCCG